MDSSSNGFKGDTASTTQHHEGLLPETFSWLDNNLARPAINDGFIQLYNTAAGIINFGTQSIAHEKPLPTVAELPVEQASFLSPGWFVQNVSGSLAMMVPYGISSKLAGGALRGVGSLTEVEGVGARVLQSDISANIAGAAIYGAAQAPGKGQTRIGNALSSGISFGIYGAGGELTQGLSMPSRLGARFVTGAAGGAAQSFVSDGVAQHRVASGKELTQSMFSGAVINVALPAFQDSVVHGIDKVNKSIGRGVPLYRHVAGQDALSQALGQSDQFKDLVRRNGWLRVVESDTNSASQSPRLFPWLKGTKGKVTIDTKVGADSSEAAPVLAHELSHIESQRSIAADLKECADLLASDPVAAQKKFLEVRKKNEDDARSKEIQVHRDLGNEEKANQLEDLRRDLPSQEALPGLTYENKWQQEFDRFVRSNGHNYPEIDYKGGRRRRAGSGDPSEWKLAELIEHFSKLDPTEQVKQLEIRATQNVSEVSRIAVALRALQGDPHKALAEAADSFLPKHLRTVDSSRKWPWRRQTAYHPVRIIEDLTHIQAVDTTSDATKLALRRLSPEIQTSAWSYMASFSKDSPPLSSVSPELRIQAWSKAFEYATEGFRKQSLVQKLADAITELPAEEQLPTIKFAASDSYVDLSKALFNVLPEAERLGGYKSLLGDPTGQVDAQWLSVAKVVMRYRTFFMDRAARHIPPVDRVAMLDSIVHHGSYSHPLGAILHELEDERPGAYLPGVITSIDSVTDPARRLSLLKIISDPHGSGRLADLYNLPIETRNQLAVKVFTDIHNLDGSHHDLRHLSRVWRSLEDPPEGRGEPHLRAALINHLPPPVLRAAVFGDIAYEPTIDVLQERYPSAYHAIVDNSLAFDSMQDMLPTIKAYTDHDGSLNGALANLPPVRSYSRSEQNTLLGVLASAASEPDLSLILPSLRMHVIDAFCTGTSSSMQGLIERVPALGEMQVSRGGYAFGAAVADVFAMLPSADRSSAWTDALNGKQPAISGFDANTVGTWARVVRNLAAANPTEFFSHALGQLNPEEQSMVLASVVQEGNVPQLKAALDFLERTNPGKFYPQVVSDISHVTDPRERLSLYDRIGFENIHKLPAETAQTLARGIFQDAIENGGADRNQLLHNWWYQLRKTERSYGGRELTGKQADAVATHLVATLPPDMIRVAVFGAEDANSSAAKLQAKEPQLYSFIIGKSASSLTMDSTAEAVEFALNLDKNDNLSGTMDKVIGKDAVYLPLSSSTVLGGYYALRATHEERVQMVRQLGNVLLDIGTGKGSRHFENAVSVAREITSLDPEIGPDLFQAPVKELLTAPDTSYHDKLNIARSLAEYLRVNDENGSFLNMELPSLRMPVETRLTDAEQEEARAHLEDSLRQPDKIRKLFGDGLLGQLLPQVFGSGDGIVGRAQGGGHQFTLEEHIARVVEAIGTDPETKTLSEKDKTDVLIAGLLHDIGKKPGGNDPHHEWVGANMVYGVLGTLGYQPERVQRISNLIARHSEVSFHPGDSISERLKNDSTFADDISLHYRRPGDDVRLRILNRSDIGNINASGSYLQRDVMEELYTNSKLLKQRAGQLNAHAVPVLTSSLPKQFGLFQAPDHYVLLSHASSYLKSSGTFMQQKSIIESPEYSMSTSLITPGHLKFYYGNSGELVALVTGPSENISQLGRNNLGTGTSVGHDGHVQLSTSWMTDSRGQSFSRELNDKIKNLAQSNSSPNGPAVNSLAELWTNASQFDNIDEVRQTYGPDSSIARAHNIIAEALTHESNGQEKSGHNEVKINNPTIVGLGIVRRGRTVNFEEADDDIVAELLHGEPAPEWLVTHGPRASDTIIIPKTNWQQALKNNLPFVALD